MQTATLPETQSHRLAKDLRRRLELSFGAGSCSRRILDQLSDAELIVQYFEHKTMLAAPTRLGNRR
jgi:hypothetical protein